MSNDIYDGVIDYVANCVGIDAREINKRTTVNDELGVDGDDGMDMLGSFSKELDVYITSTKDTCFLAIEGLSLSVVFYSIL